MNFGKRNEEYRRDELLRAIEHALEKLSLSELEAIEYDLLTKGYMD